MRDDIEKLKDRRYGCLIAIGVTLACWVLGFLMIQDRELAAIGIYLMVMGPYVGFIITS